MFRKITSVALALLLMLALVTAAFAAADDPIAPAPTKISFDTKTTGWEGFSYVGFHIWGVDGEQFYDWGGKKQRGTDEGDGVWSYDPAAKGITLDPEKQYAVIFYTDKGQQTYNLLFDATCLGDTAYADPSNLVENPEDSQKMTLPAYWRHQDRTINGPELKITSIGNVVGSCCPKNTTREGLFEGFLKNTLENARQFTGMHDQDLIDHVGEGLEIGADAVELMIATSGVEVNWSFDASTLCKEPRVPSTEDPTGPEWYEFDAYVAEGSGTAKVSTDMWDADAWEEDDGITLTATSAEGYHFGYWEIIGTYRIFEGDLTSPVLLIHPASHITAKAHFIETVPGNPNYVAYTVDVAEGEGTAAGDKDVLEINYSLPPEYVYDTVTLTATPAEGYVFMGWTIEGDYEIEGGGKLTDGVLTLRAHNGIAAHAHFYENVPGRSDWVAYTVDVASGEGTAKGDKDILIINYSVAPDYQYDTVTLTATPAEGWYLAGWKIEGDYELADGGKLTDAVLTVRAHDGIAAHAYFYAEDWSGSPSWVPYTVDVTQGEGAAEGDKDILIINFTVAPEYAYDTVTLTATPAEGWCFEEWEIEGFYEIENGGKLTDAVLTLRARDGIAAHAKFYIDVPVVVDPINPTGIRGDADGDGKITILDATRIQRYIAGLAGEDEISMKDADADGDGKVTVLDATRIQRVLAKLCDMEGNKLTPGQDEYELPFVKA